MSLPHSLFKSVLICIVFPLALSGQSFHSKAKRLIGTFNVYHFNPLSYDEKTSAEIADLFINELDDIGFFLDAADVKNLEANKEKLLQQVQDNSDDYYQNARRIYVNALSRCDSVFAILEKKTLNFSENDTVSFLTIRSKTFYSPTRAYHAKRIERNLKSRCYDRVINAGDYEKMSETEFNAKANEYAKTIVKNFREKLKEAKEGAGIYVEATLLNAIATRYDPHSNYFTEEQNKEFNRSISSKTETFGFFLDEDEDGNIIIGGMEPGGSAWLSNQLNEGDFLQSVKIGGLVLSPADKSLVQIEEKIAGSTEKTIFLTVKKPNGHVKTVKLVKQKVDSEENSVKGYVLKKDGLKLGYISLPSFYTDIDNTSKPGCANDVAKEILKLEKDSISGLIIDLRNNGGGSMLEAMNLAGIFVDEGPLFIYKVKNKKPQLVKDINRGSIFKKPLVVMINETSASASELFSNIVKDYNLGVVVGQTSYGKGTAQQVLPLDTNLLRMKSPSATNRDFIKLTDGKFYRLNGSTHQGLGVVPDIILPKFPAFSAYRESKEKFYILPDSVVKKVVFTPNLPLNLGAVKARSAERISAGPAFKRFRQSSDSLEIFLNTLVKVPLKHRDYLKHREKSDKIFDSFEKAMYTAEPNFKCLNNSFDEKLNTYNEVVTEFNNRIIQNIEKDLFVNETFLILSDIIQTPK